MTMKQKMIEAMMMAAYEPAKTIGDRKLLELDAALAVMADPANWTDEMDVESVVADATHGNKHETFAAVSFRTVINHIRGQ